MDNRIGLLKFSKETERFSIIFENNIYDSVELTSGTVVFINMLGWKKCRIEFNGTDNCYYGVGLPAPLKDDLQASLKDPASN